MRCTPRKKFKNLENLVVECHRFGPQSSCSLESSARRSRRRSRRNCRKTPLTAPAGSFSLREAVASGPTKRIMEWSSAQHSSFPHRCISIHCIYASPVLLLRSKNRTASSFAPLHTVSELGIEERATPKRDPPIDSRSEARDAAFATSLQRALADPLPFLPVKPHQRRQFAHQSARLARRQA